jgi:hypothetical protein
MITNPYSGRQIPGTGVLDLSVEKKKSIKEDHPQQEQLLLMTASASTATIPNGKPAGKSIQWTTELTNTFLRFMPEANKSLKRDKDKHNKGKIWIELFDKFKETIIAEKSADERFLDMVASEHLQNKWKDLKKRYNLISNSGKSSVDWPFYEQLQAILKDDDTTNNDDNNNEKEKPEKPEKPPTKQAIEPEDPGITPLKRVASDFMEELKATLEEDRKLRRIDLENEGRRRQAETCVLMSSILDEMQSSSDNSFRLMRSFIQTSLGERPPPSPHQRQPAQALPSLQQRQQEPQPFHPYQLPPHRHFH